MNVVFIMNDTWRYDHVRANGNDWISTPNLDAFAAESAVFRPLLYRVVCNDSLSPRPDERPLR